MTTFEDGPAAGITLFLKRSPIFLRVVQNGTSFDALDQLTDEPEYTEIIHVYILVAPPQAWTIGPGGCHPVCRYRYANPQPDDTVVRDTQSWRAWTLLPETHSLLTNKTP